MLHSDLLEEQEASVGRGRPLVQSFATITTAIVTVVVPKFLLMVVQEEEVHHLAMVLQLGLQLVN